MPDDTPRVFLAAYHDGLSPRYEVVPEGAMGAEEWEPKGAGVRVKALEWDGGHAVTPFGDLLVMTGQNVSFYNGLEFRAGDHFQAAKAAAQADFDARIRAVIELTTEPEPGPEVCHKCGGAGWLWGHELDNYEHPHPGQSDDTRYSCDGPLCMANSSSTPTSGAYDLICCTAEDVATGRGFTGDAAADLAMAQESLRDCLKLLAWRG